MLTLFSIPKPFSGSIDKAQVNAIQSWTRLSVVSEVVLFGDEEGVAEAADNTNVVHVPDVLRSDYGTPLLSDVFRQIHRRDNTGYLCYVNTDIILMDDFSLAVEATLRATRRFLLTGRRWNIDLYRGLEFDDPDWQTHLRNQVLSSGELFTPMGMDYFLFPNESAVTTIPPFAVGRPGWDNWLIFHARRLGLAVIDATNSIMAVHQNHDYQHVPCGDGNTYDGPEAEANWILMGGKDYWFGLADATHEMRGHHIRLRRDRASIRRHWRRLPVLRPELSPLVRSVSLAKNRLVSVLRR